MDDSKIVELYLARDQRAIACTQKEYGPRLRALAYDIVEDRLTAQECENDTYLQAWNTIPPQEPRAYLFSYLARITRNIALDFCRRRSALKREAMVQELTQELEMCIPGRENTYEKVSGILLGECISRWLRRQTMEHRVMFLRRYWYLDSVAAIASRFGCTQSKVKSTLFRLRNGLREYLKKEGYWHEGQ